MLEKKQLQENEISTMCFNFFISTCCAVSVYIRDLSTRLLSAKQVQVHQFCFVFRSTYVGQGQNRCAQWLQFRILHPKERAGSLIWWSVCRSLRSVIRWILDQSGFDRSLIWKTICSKGKPQIRNPDPDIPKGTHLRFFCSRLYRNNLILAIVFGCL